MQVRIYDHAQRANLISLETLAIGMLIEISVAWLPESVKILISQGTATSIHQGFFDTPRSKDTGILGSTRPLKLDSLRYLTQRWDSPQALTFGLPDRSCIAASPVEYETRRFQNSDSCFDFAQHKSSSYKSFTYC